MDFPPQCGSGGVHGGPPSPTAVANCKSFSNPCPCLLVPAVAVPRLTNPPGPPAVSQAWRLWPSLVDAVTKELRASEIQIALSKTQHQRHRHSSSSCHFFKIGIHSFTGTAHLKFPDGMNSSGQSCQLPVPALCMHDLEITIMSSS